MLMVLRSKASDAKSNMELDAIGDLAALMSVISSSRSRSICSVFSLLLLDPVVACSELPSDPFWLIGAEDVPLAWASNAAILSLRRCPTHHVSGSRSTLGPMAPYCISSGLAHSAPSFCPDRPRQAHHQAFWTSWLLLQACWYFLRFTLCI